MMMNRIQNAKDELLREAAKGGNQICKMKTGTGFFVKARRGYSHPEEIRTLYTQAFDALVREGKFKMVLRNKDLELYEVARVDGHVASKAHAKEVLMREIEQAGQVFKIHSPDGEFVQIGHKAYCEIEDERILFLEALYELVRHGQFRLVSDSKELSRFELGRPQYPMLDNSQLEYLTPTTYAA